MPLPSARLYPCARCRIQVLICRRCDRGQRYCTGSCAQAARSLAQRAARQRYQTSLPGRLKHAARSRRYRARRQNNVTHQGSRMIGTDAVLALTMRAPDFSLATFRSGHCQWCGVRCSARVRQDFLRQDRGESLSTRRRQ